MNPSPLRGLVARHVCACRPVLRRSAAGRLVFAASQRKAQYATPPSAFGSAESLSRRFQPVPSSIQALRAERVRASRNMRFSGYGIAMGFFAVFATVWFYPWPKDEKKKDNSDKTVSFDSPPSIRGIPDISHPDHVDQVPTGTSTIPTFPRTISLPSSPAPSSASPSPTIAPLSPSDEVEYQLVGLGIRTVSILSIQVYVVGLYIAVQDIATLQERLIRTIDPVATTLVPSEKATLKSLLLDPTRGEEIWNAILTSPGLRTTFRIVPTRNTDFMHMRDGFVRGITARATHFAHDLKDSSFIDETFGASLNDFKTVFGGTARRKIPYGETLWLTRDAQGKFAAVHEDKQGVRMPMGEVADERVARLLWLNYLAGASVSSEPARRSVVDGVMEYVERPVGTVAAQVV